MRVSIPLPQREHGLLASILMDAVRGQAAGESGTGAALRGVHLQRLQPVYGHSVGNVREVRVAVGRVLAAVVLAGGMLTACGQGSGDHLLPDCRVEPARCGGTSPTTSVASTGAWDLTPWH